MVRSITPEEAIRFLLEVHEKKELEIKELKKVIELKQDTIILELSRINQGLKKLEYSKEFDRQQRPGDSSIDDPNMRIIYEIGETIKQNNTKIMEVIKILESPTIKYISAD